MSKKKSLVPSFELCERLIKNMDRERTGKEVTVACGNKFTQHSFGWTTEKLSEDSRSVDPETNPGSPECEARVPVTHQRAVSLLGRLCAVDRVAGITWFKMHLETPGPLIILLKLIPQNLS